MKLLGYILFCCMVISALQWAVLALAIAAMIAWAVSLIRHPRATLTFMCGLVLLSAFNEHPLIFVGTFAVLGLISLVAKHGAPSRTQIAEANKEPSSSPVCTTWVKS